MTSRQRRAPAGAGEIVDPSLYYFRTTPAAEVSPGPHAWLLENIFVGVGERPPDRVRIRVFQLG